MAALQPTTPKTPKALLITRVLLAGFFLFSGTVKLVDLPRFHEAVINFQLVDGPLAEWITLIVPTAELVLGVLFLFNILPMGTLSLLIGMMVTFTVAIGMAWSRGLDITCGCFGKLSDKPMEYPMTMLGNSAIIILLIGFLVISLRKPRIMSKHGYTLPKNLLYEKDGGRRA